MRLEVAALERELEPIGRQRFIEQQARGYGLGSSREIPFALAAGRAAARRRRPGLGRGPPRRRHRTTSRPLERWLTCSSGPRD